MNRFLAATAVAVSLLASHASAQGCGGTYTVKRGDSLSLIADRQYKDARKWTAIHSANLPSIGDNPDAIQAGMHLRLTCIGGLPTGLPDATATVIQTAVAAPVVTGPKRKLEAQINLVTADDYAPFTDRKALNGGLITEVVHAAMMAGAGADGYAVHWVNDWSAHIDPLLSNGMMDMGFPWLKPDCTSTPDNDRCRNALFSDPMFEMLVLLFVDKARPIAFATDADLHGRTLCRPAGYYTHDLEKDGRLWLSNNRITLEQPDSVADCFEMLTQGKVDAVALNEFTGRAAIKSLGLTDRVEVVQGRPLSIEGLHVLVHKDHPQAEALLMQINEGLGAIKASGQYQQVIDTHMSKIWEDF